MPVFYFGYSKLLDKGSKLPNDNANEMITTGETNRTNLYLDVHKNFYVYIHKTYNEDD